jgi:excisionase family DNA binding protein
MTTETPERFLNEISTVAAAEKYNMTPSYVARLARTHTIRARKFGRDWIIDEEALRNYLAQPRKPGPRPHGTKGQTGTNSVETPDTSRGKGEYRATTKGYGNSKTVSQ